MPRKGTTTNAPKPKAFGFDTNMPEFEPVAAQNAVCRTSRPLLSAAAKQHARQTRIQLEKTKSKEAGTATTAGPCWIDALHVMCTATLKEAFTGE